MMKHIFASRFILILAIAFAFGSCKKPDTDTEGQHPSSTCQLTKVQLLNMREPNNVNSFHPFAEWELIYEDGKVKRVNYTNKEMDVFNEYRTIEYQNDKPSKISNFNKQNEVQTVYQFTYDPAQPDLVKSISIEFFNVNPKRHARYDYEYDEQKRRKKITRYYSVLGGTTLFISGYHLFTYNKVGSTELVTHEAHNLSHSDPTYDKIQHIEEFKYDDKKTADMWPVFVFARGTGLQHLPLLQPTSTHNVTQYTLKSYNESQSTNGNNVFDIDRNMSYMNGIQYTSRNIGGQADGNAAGYPSSYYISTFNGSEAMYNFAYSNCIK